MLAHDIRNAITQLGKFRINREFTEGCNSYTFEAVHIHLNREVFLKLYEYSATFTTEILREPRTLEAIRAVRSPNVVEVFDAEIIEIGKEKYVCLQLELVRGESLLSLLQRGEIGQQDAVRRRQVS